FVSKSRRKFFSKLKNFLLEGFLRVKSIKNQEFLMLFTLKNPLEHPKNQPDKVFWMRPNEISKVCTLLNKHNITSIRRAF
ncbi:MAG: hypothetical protein AAGI49_20260, partial [Bacteroidota bacterium]